MNDPLFEVDYAAYAKSRRRINGTKIIAQPDPIRTQSVYDLPDIAIYSQESIDMCMNCTREKCGGRCKRSDELERSVARGRRGRK